MKRRSILLALVLLAAPAVAATVNVRGPADRKGWYEERIPVLVEGVAEELSVDFDREITVILARTDAEFRREVPGASDWAAAVALPGKATLVVRLPALGPGRGLGANSVLRHELVHLLLPERIGWDRAVPRWFEEGLAQVIGGRLLRVDEATLPVTAAAGRLIPLAALERSFPRSANRAGLAYAQGESVVNFLLDRRGREGLMSLLDAMKAGRSFDAGLDDVYGLSRGELEEQWKEWIDEEGRPWWEVILSVATIPFLLFVASLLAIVAFIRMRRRGRRIYDSLPE